MPVRVESHAEPIPGYKLIERLGGGGFGEVWKAEAPGGLFKAIKFVFGDLHALDDEDGSRAKQELKALSRVKTVHHPFILSLERYDIIDGQLIIVMELADRTLWDRFKECRSQGLPGIPREELLSYMEETAEALDLMNDQYKLQHLDIKPQNLFLVFNHVKVADFGLVKDLEGISATVTGGVTPVYAAPETFDGWVSRSSDQYSLAIVYQELLTGQRPFTGNTIRQLVLQHMQGQPDLSSLLRADRVVVSQALSKNHEHRFPSCLEFIRKLRKASAASAPVVAATPMEKEDTLPVPVGMTPSVMPAAEISPLDTSITCNARGRLARPLIPESAGTEGVPLPMAPVPRRPPKPVPIPGPAPGNVATNAAAVRPALVVGLGQAGLDIIRQLRNELAEQSGFPSACPHLRLLGIDTDPEAVQTAIRGGDDSLQANEVLLARLRRPSHYLKSREGKSPFESWLNTKLLYAIPRQHNHAGLRALGRLAFVDHYTVISQKVKVELEACINEALDSTTQINGQELTSPRVYIVAGLAGGTGSGMFLDLAYLVRRILRQQGFKNPTIVGLFLLPTSESSEGAAKSLVNAYAALTELSHFAAPGAVFTARYDQCDGDFADKPFQEKGPPFQRCMLLPLPALRAANAAVRTASLGQASHYLYWELMTPVEHSRAADGARPVEHQVFGLHRMVWPHRIICRQSARRLCARLLDHWMSKDSSPLKAATSPWVQEQWERLGFRPETVIARHQEQCEQLLKKAPEAMWSEMIDPLGHRLQSTGAPGQDAMQQWAPVVQAVDLLEKFLGVPGEFQTLGPGGKHAESATVEKILRQASQTLAGEYEQTLAELIVRLFEEPALRMAGAEEAIREFSTCVQKAIESQEPLLRELQSQTVALYKRIHILLESPTQASHSTPHSRWRAPFTRKPSSDQSQTPEILELLRYYAKGRYQLAVLQSVNALYVSLRGVLSDQMREIGFCRQRLAELADLFNVPAAEPAGRTLAQHLLLPEGCSNLQEAVGRVDEAIGSEELLAFDGQVQDLIRTQYRALVNVCLASSTVVRDLSESLLQEAERYLESRVEATDAAALFLSKYTLGSEGRDRLEADLHKAYEEAVPQVGPAAEENETLVISAPKGSAGDQLRKLAAEIFPGASLVCGNRNDEILFLRQSLTTPIAEFEHLGPDAQEAYRQRVAQDPSFVHSRADIEEWRVVIPVS